MYSIIVHYFTCDHITRVQTAQSKIQLLGPILHVRFRQPVLSHRRSVCGSKRSGWKSVSGKRGNLCWSAKIVLLPTKSKRLDTFFVCSCFVVIVVVFFLKKWLLGQVFSHFCSEKVELESCKTKTDCIRDSKKLKSSFWTNLINHVGKNCQQAFRDFIF